LISSSFFSCLQAIDIKHPLSTKNGKVREKHQEGTKQNVGNTTRNTALYQTFYGK
jgi:hypothetical protein